VSRATQVRTHAASWFRLQDYHPLWSRFPTRFTYQSTYALLYALQPLSGLLETGLGSSRFARTTKGISSISLPGGTKIFQFPPFAHLTVYPLRGGFPHSDISGSLVVWHLTEAYRSHTTSFIACHCQGILRALLTSLQIL
jgi:hypothetical protein